MSVKVVDGNSTESVPLGTLDIVLAKGIIFDIVLVKGIILKVVPQSNFIRIAQQSCRLRDR